jgi:hypothetical protein
VRSNVAVEVVPDDSREREFQSVIAGWNAKVPTDAKTGVNARAEAAKAALDRMAQEQQSGERPWSKTRSNGEGKCKQTKTKMRFEIRAPWLLNSGLRLKWRNKCPKITFRSI